MPDTKLKQRGRRSQHINQMLRREKVHECLVAGIRAPTRIARELGVDKSTISRDIKWMEAQFLESVKETVGIRKGRQGAQFAALYEKWFPLATADSHEELAKDGPVSVQGPSPKAAHIVLKAMHEEAAVFGFNVVEDKDKNPNTFKELAAKAAAAKEPEPEPPKPEEVTPEVVAEAAEARHKGILS